MGRHSAPHTDYDGTPLPLTHFPGHGWRDGELTPCGLPYIRRSSSGQLVTAVPTAINPALVNCETCYATEDIKHRQDHDYGRHSAPHAGANPRLDGWASSSHLLSSLLRPHPTTPAGSETPGRGDVGAGIEVLVDTPDITLWTGR